MSRRRDDDDFAAEVQAHLDLEADRLIADGMRPAEAPAAAHRAFGSAVRAREDFHERGRSVGLEQFCQDVRYAWRTLRGSPAFLMTTVVTLAVGLSLLTVAFSVFNAYVLRPFAVADPYRLYRLAWRAPGAVGNAFPWRDYDELRARTDLFDAVIANEMRFVSSEFGPLVVSAVSDNYFPTLRPRLAAGRPLAAVDRGQPVVLIRQQAAKRLFGGDREALGRTFTLDTTPVTVVGVVRDEFGGLDDFPYDLWRPAAPDGAGSTPVVVRLRAGVSPVQAALRLQEFATRLAPPDVPGRDVRAVLVPSGTPNPLSVEIVALLSPVFAAFLLVLLAACVNVSNVMLARAVSRHREIAVRLSLGASRARIVRQLLTEGLLIAVLAGGAALVLAAWLVRAAVVILFSTLPPFVASLLRVAPTPLDWRVFVFAFGCALSTTLGFALVPALQASRRPLTDALRGQLTGRPSASRARHALVVVQVALSIMLVVTALVLARNFTALVRLDLGYSTKDVYSINVRGEQDRLVRPVAEALSIDPRIESIAVTSGNPLFVTRSVPMGAGGAAALTPTMYTFVSPEFLPMLRVPILRGRAFTADEARRAARVALVSDSTARAFWPGHDPIGAALAIQRPAPPRTDGIDGYAQVTVVGVVPDMVSGIMMEGSDRAHIYLPAAAADPHVSALLIQPRDPAAFRPDMLRETFRRLRLDPDTFEVISLDEMRDTQVYPVRAASWVGALLGGIALLLSVSGLYGVLAYTLAQRRREIGIRMALGATAKAVVGLMLRQTARTAGTGVAIGLALAFAALAALASAVELRAVSILDPIAFAAAAVTVAAAAALAAYVPSRRAARVDPAETLRAEG
ncbi:MAG TPA: ABC transporter permease [Vicinamibacterales bacterium]|jgi:predicted permease